MLNQSILGLSVVLNADMDLSSKAGEVKHRHSIQIETDVAGTGAFEIWARVKGASTFQKLPESFNAAVLVPVYILGIYDVIRIIPNGIATATLYSVHTSSRA